MYHVKVFFAGLAALIGILAAVVVLNTWWPWIVGITFALGFIYAFGRFIMDPRDE